MKYEKELKQLNKDLDKVTEPIKRIFEKEDKEFVDIFKQYKIVNKLVGDHWEKHLHQIILEIDLIKAFGKMFVKNNAKDMLAKMREQEDAKQKTSTGNKPS